MVKLELPPEHKFAIGVIVIVAVTADDPLLTPANDDMFPVPLAAKPIDGVLFVQLNTVPDTPPLNPTDEVETPLHTI